MSRVVAALACALALWGAARDAHAQEDTDVPQARWALVLGGRENVGALGNQFGRGWLIGVEAGWQPGRLGLAWSLHRGAFDTSDPTAAESELRLIEMQFGLRLRWPIGRTSPRFFLANAGVTAMRSNVPIPPESSRDYVGPFAGIGFEQLLVGRYMISVETRYGLFVGGPAGLTLNISLAFGSG